MPNLSCRSCGRQLYTVTPLVSLFADERRCPRCGSPLFDDRREGERRTDNRRKNPPDDPGPPAPPAPPKGRGKGKKAGPPDAAAGERRVADRRTTRRRGRG